PFVFAAAFAARAVAVEHDYDFSGTFAKDNDIQSEFITITSLSSVTAFTSSWQTFDPGHGFDPILGVWDSAGNRVYELDDGDFTGTTFSNGVGYDSGELDSYFMRTLGPGTYRFVLTQYNNYSVGPLFSQGFKHDAEPNFTFVPGDSP